MSMRGISFVSISVLINRASWLYYTFVEEQCGTFVCSKRFTAVVLHVMYDALLTLYKVDKKFELIFTHRNS